MRARFRKEACAAGLKVSTSAMEVVKTIGESYNTSVLLTRPDPSAMGCLTVTFQCGNPKRSVKAPSPAPHMWLGWCLPTANPNKKSLFNGSGFFINTSQIHEMRALFPDCLGTAPTLPDNNRGVICVRI
jgi:hypothetical protein